MGNGTDLAILITLIVIAVLVAIIVIVSLRNKAEKQTGNIERTEAEPKAPDIAATEKAEEPEEAKTEVITAAEPAEPETEVSEVIEIGMTETEAAKPETEEELPEIDDIFGSDDFTISEIKPLEETEEDADIETAAEEDAASAEAAAEQVPAEVIPEGTPELAGDDPVIKNYNTGRSGHSYSKEELEEQIRI